MVKRKKTLVATAVAFASSPAGRRAIQQARAYAARPENQERVRKLVEQAKAFAARPENQARIQKLAKQVNTRGGAARSKSTADPADPPYGTPKS